MTNQTPTLKEIIDSKTRIQIARLKKDILSKVKFSAPSLDNYIYGRIKGKPATQKKICKVVGVELDFERAHAEFIKKRLKKDKRTISQRASARQTTAALNYKNSK